MTSSGTPSPLSGPLPYRWAIAVALVAFAAFHTAWCVPGAWAGMLAFLACLVVLTRVASTRLAFYGGLVLGIATYGVQLIFFWRIFGVFTLLLWIVIGFWTAIFLLLGVLARRTMRGWMLMVLLGSLWTAVECFRSEMYPLKFSWMAAGYSLAGLPDLARIGLLGIYGIGFVMMLLAGALVSGRTWVRAGVLVVVLALALRTSFAAWPRGGSASALRVAGVQLEFPGPEDAAVALDRLACRYPDAPLLLLPEYTFDGPVPEIVRAVCRKQHRYLVAGGHRPTADGKDFYSTAFVIGPDGKDLFEQAKCVPVQFMRDGRPAEQQRLWQSPWGPIGLCVCYDLSYRRVVDELVRRGACAIITPTMDAETWGLHERLRLHGRVGPMRAAEYGIPIVRIASSGISQVIQPSGQVTASGGFPGPGAMFSGAIPLARRGRVPLDRWLVAASMLVTCGFILHLAATSLRGRRGAGPPT